MKRLRVRLLPNWAKPEAVLERFQTSGQIGASSDSIGKRFWLLLIFYLKPPEPDQQLQPSRLDKSPSKILHVFDAVASLACTIAKAV